jgi:Rha family phage regulatory protein
VGDLVFISDGKPVTDSLTVSDVFNKRHSDVLRDIEIQIEKLNEAKEENFVKRNFALSHYRSGNREYKKYNMTEEAFTIVAMAYVTPEAMKMKVRFINEFKRMREQIQSMNQPSYMIEDPITRAERWIQEQKEKQLLEQKLQIQAPMVDYYQRILNSSDTVTTTQIAQDYGLSAYRLNKILHDEGIQYKLNGQWILYQKYKDKGFIKSQTVDITHTDGRQSVKMHTKWTQKGRLFIHRLLEKRGIYPQADMYRKEA